MKKFIWSLVVLCLISCVDSTVYSGYIYNENEKPLPDVKVQIVGSDIVTYTDKNGFFSIDHKQRGKEILAIKPGYVMQFYSPASQDEKIELVLKAEKEKQVL